MDFDLSPDHELIRRTVRDFAQQEVAPVAEELDREKRFPYEIVAKLGELGLMGIPFPEEYGGAGADSLAYALAVEELTRVDSSVAITLCAHTSLGTQPIYLFGSATPAPAPGWTTASGWSTAPSSSSPTRAPTSPPSSASRRGPATTRSPT
jgi:alkylation response protein AidB-like acyl-CoA dehydrogenase